MRIEATRPFEHDYDRLSDQLKERVDQQLALLLLNLRHPSLRLKRIVSTASLWEARVTRGYRLVLQIEGETILLHRVGTHDILRNL